MLRRFLPALLMLSLVPASIAAAAIGSQGTAGSSTTTGTALTSTTSTATTTSTSSGVPRRTLIRQIERYKRVTWRWERLMGVRRTGTANRSLDAAADGTLVAVRNKWRRFAVRARLRALHPPHRSAWLCIHRFEASWQDGGAPYYGGLQMDWSFMSHYGRELLRRKGDASHWTPLEQMWVAERAHRSGRGFYPWPNTARYCGLL
jgi:hypothetical protein